MARGTNKRAVSFRFWPDTIERLKRRSREAGTPQAALAERYIDVGMRMDEHPGVYFREGGSGRRPVSGKLCDDPGHLRLRESPQRRRSQVPRCTDARHDGGDGCVIRSFEDDDGVVVP